MRTVFFDLETGGLDPAKHPIIQIAAIAVDEQLAEIDYFQAKSDFDMALADPDALAANCYDREKWDRESQPERFVLSDFGEFLRAFADLPMTSRAGRSYSVAQLIGHNAATFDAPFLQAAFKRHDMFLPASFRVMDTLQRAIWHFHERRDLSPPADFKLGTLCAYFGIPLIEAHDALADVRATVELYRCLTKSLTAAA